MQYKTECINFISGKPDNPVDLKLCQYGKLCWNYIQNIAYCPTYCPYYIDKKEVTDE
jgi:hypothetical protein